MSKSPFSTLMPSNLASTNLASSLRDAAELVVDATTASAKTISAAMPDSVPELAASLPSVIPFVSNQRSRRRSSQVRRVVIVGAVVALVVGVTIVLRNRAQRQSDDVTEVRDPASAPGRAPLHRLLGGTERVVNGPPWPDGQAANTMTQ